MPVQAALTRNLMVSRIQAPLVACLVEPRALCAAPLVVPQPRFFANLAAASDGEEGGAGLLGAAADEVDIEVGDDEVLGAKAVRRNIRVSPQKLNLLCAQIRGLPVEEALTQMKFSKKRHAALVGKVLQNAVNVADIDHELEPDELIVAKAYVGHGKILKRILMMGRGRHGKLHHRYSHLFVDVSTRTKKQLHAEKQREAAKTDRSGKPDQPLKEFPGKIFTAGRYKWKVSMMELRDGAQKIEWNPVRPEGVKRVPQQIKK
jgi:large subunit ribosomal protein L22